MMNSIISLNDMISKALECVDAERNAKTRKKSHTSKSRKQDFSRAKRHAKHCQYKQQRNEKLVHPAINRNAQRSIDEAKLYSSDCRCSDKQHSEKRDCDSCASFKLLPPKHYRHTNHQHNSQNRRSTASYFRRSDACITVSRYVWRLIICRDWLSLFYRDA